MPSMVHARWVSGKSQSVALLILGGGRAPRGHCALTVRGLLLLVNAFL